MEEDLREKVDSLLLNLYGAGLNDKGRAVPTVWITEIRDQIHALYQQAGWKSPEEYENLVQLSASLIANEKMAVQDAKVLLEMWNKGVDDGTWVHKDKIEQAKKEAREEVLNWVQANALFVNPHNKAWQAKLKEWQALKEKK